MKTHLPRPQGCSFDERKADRAVRFFSEYLNHTKGKLWARKPFVLYPWQEVHIREIFGRVNPDGRRTIRQVLILVPKKNGKGELCAGTALKLLLADDEPGAEVYTAAMAKRQAALIFDVAGQMVRLDRRLSRRANVIASTKRIAVMEGPCAGSFLSALSKEAGISEGLNAHGVFFDEIQEQPTTELWDILTVGSGGGRTEPLVFGIGTAGLPGESPVAEMLFEDAKQMLDGVLPPDPSFYPVVYSVPDKDPWDNEESWFASNPALHSYRHRVYGELPAFKNIDEMRKDFQYARRRPAQENSFRRRHLNQWTSQETRAIQMSDWDDCGQTVDYAALKDLPCYGGLDLSSTTDLTALVLDFPSGGLRFVLPYFWLPEARVPQHLSLWAQRGLISTTPGDAVDYEAVRQRVKELAQNFRIVEVAFDPWNAIDLANRLSADGLKMVPVRQGYNLSAAAKEVCEDLLLSRRLRHGGHPVLRWMAGCLTLKQDWAGNVKPVKPDRKKSKARIDGMVALIMAEDRAMRSPGTPERSAYVDVPVIVI